MQPTKLTGRNEIKRMRRHKNNQKSKYHTPEFNLKQSVPSCDTN